MKHEKSCGCIVINEEDKILLVHQTVGHWGLPKGHVEDGETEEETAIREVKEETNIDVKINKKYRYSMEYFIKEDVMKEAVFFVARSLNKDNKAQLEEVSELEWLDFNSAIERVTYDNTKELLKKVKKDLNM